MSMLSDNLLARLNECFTRYNIGAKDRLAILKWANDALTAVGVLENVELGHLDIAEWKDGQPSMCLTAAGKNYVEDNLLPGGKAADWPTEI